MRRINLSYKLTLLIVFPLLLVFVVGIYAWNGFEIISNELLLAALLLSVVIYIPLSVNFIRKLATGISTLEKTSVDLASGKFVKARTPNIPEFHSIGASLNAVSDEVQRQAKFAEQIKSGDLDASYQASHDQDRLGHALLQIKESMIAIKQEEQQRIWASEGLAKFVTVLQSAKNLKALSNDIIVNLVRIIKANQGAIYILDKDNDEKEFLEMQACYAYDRSKHLSQKIVPGEGLVGQAFLERDTLYLRDVPDQFVKITSGLGEANPRHVLIVPLRMNEAIAGIVEVASFKEFSKHEVAFVEKIGESIAHTFTSFQVAEHTKKLLDESNAHAAQMREQEEELRQNQEELQATQEEISRKYDALFKQLGELNYQSKFDQLKSITSTKKRNIEYYFDIIRNQILTFSEDRMIIEAVNAFRSTFYKVGADASLDQVNSMKENLTEYYVTEFIAKLNDNTSWESKAEAYMPTDLRATMLQYLFISNNPQPTGKKSLLDDPNDGSDYSQVHKLYHPILRNFLEKFGYYDIFLIDAATGDMVYSVFKEIDFATNLRHGLYKETNFGKVVKEAMESSDKDFVRLIDFEPYDPSYHAPASFIACSVYDGEEKMGILTFQMPINKINQILTGNTKWREDGLGESGETFIVGSDYKLRSISRALIQDATSHLSALKKLKYDVMILQQIEKMETNILMEETKQESVTNALSGMTGTQLEKNKFGIDMLSAYAPLEIADVKWIIMSTMKEEEASMRINNLREENA